MRKILLFVVFFLYVLLQFACSGQNTKQDENLGKASDAGATTEYNPGTMDFRAIDETVNTQWVTEFPQNEDLSAFTGEVAVYGNEPFTYFVLKVNAQEKYGLIGNKKFIDFLKNNASKITVSGKVITEEKKNWIQVFYIIKGGE